MNVSNVGEGSKRGDGKEGKKKEEEEEGGEERSQKLIKRRKVFIIQLHFLRFTPLLTLPSCIVGSPLLPMIFSHPVPFRLISFLLRLSPPTNL